MFCQKNPLRTLKTQEFTFSLYKIINKIDAVMFYLNIKAESKLQHHFSFYFYRTP